MSDRLRATPPPRDRDGEPLIDAGAIIAILGLTPSGTRKMLRRRRIAPIRRGAHGTYLYRLADVEDLLAERRAVVSSEIR